MQWTTKWRFIILIPVLVPNLRIGGGLPDVDQESVQNEDTDNTTAVM